MNTYQTPQVSNNSFNTSQMNEIKMRLMVFNALSLPDDECDGAEDEDDEGLITHSSWRLFPNAPGLRPERAS